MGTTKDIREAVEAELEFDPLVDALARSGVPCHAVSARLRAAGRRLRGVNYWLPLPPGAIAYLRLRLRTGADGKRKGKGKPVTAQPG